MTLNPITLIVDALADTFVPEGLRKPLAYLAMALALAGLLWGAKAAYDASVVDDYEDKRATAALPEYDRAAEQRSADAISGILAEKDRTDAIAKAAASEAAKPPSERATVAPQTRAFNCAVMRQDYSERELAKMDAYQENCRS